MKTLLHTLFIALPLLLTSVCPVQAAETDDTTDEPPARRERATKARNVNRAAQQKKKELRQQGVRRVRVQSPNGWPDKIPVPEETTLHEEGKQGEQFVYRTNTYEFFSPVALDSNACDTIGRLFECARAANCAVGEVLPVPRTDALPEGKRFRVLLCPTRAQYRQMGGSDDSRGVFQFAIRPGAYPVKEADLAQDRVVVPFESLGLDISGKVAKNDIETHTLVHELTHQNFVLNSLPTWANEGWAEYIGYVPYVGEDLDFTRCYAVILNKAQKRASQGALDFPFTLEEFLTMPQQEMYAYMDQRADTYTLATMLVAFFVHLDGKKGIEAMKNYMQAILDGTPHDEAKEHLITPHRNAEKLQKDFVKMWKRKKVHVSFSDAD